MLMKLDIVNHLRPISLIIQSFQLNHGFFGINENRTINFQFFFGQRVIVDPIPKGKIIDNEFGPNL